jgi:hypothetical protein
MVDKVKVYIWITIFTVTKYQKCMRSMYCIIIIIIIIRWHYSTLRTFASLMDFCKLSLLLDHSFQLLIVHLLLPVSTQFQHLFLGCPVSRVLWGLLLNI